MAIATNCHQLVVKWNRQHTTRFVYFTIELQCCSFGSHHTRLTDGRCSNYCCVNQRTIQIEHGTPTENPSIKSYLPLVSVPRPSPFLTALLLPCIYKLENKDGRAGNETAVALTLKHTLVSDKANHQCYHLFHYSNLDVYLPPLAHLLLSWQLIDKSLVLL